MPTDTDSIRDTLKSMFDMLNKREFEGFDQVFHPEGRLFLNGTPQPADFLTNVKHAPYPVGFEIDDVWVVGYGLDFADRYRTLPYIGVIEPER